MHVCNLFGLGLFSEEMRAESYVYSLISLRIEDIFMYLVPIRVTKILDNSSLLRFCVVRTGCCPVIARLSSRFSFVVSCINSAPRLLFALALLHLQQEDG
jgi:hypothetical protein